jgi:hypothetical protein
MLAIKGDSEVNDSLSTQAVDEISLTPSIFLSAYLSVSQPLFVPVADSSIPPDLLSFGAWILSTPEASTNTPRIIHITYHKDKGHGGSVYLQLHHAWLIK